MASQGRGWSSAAATSKMERFVIIVNNFQPRSATAEVQSSSRLLVRRICIWDVKIAVLPWCSLRKGTLKINSKYTGERPCGNMTNNNNNINNYMEITCASLNMPYFFKIPFRKSTSGGLLLAWAVSRSMLLIQIHNSFTSPHWITSGGLLSSHAIYKF